MVLGVISDTHGEIGLTQQATLMFREFGVTQVVHCGDIGSASIIPLFRGFDAHFVFGNCDCMLADLRNVIVKEHQTCHEYFGHITVGGKLIAFLHGHDQLLFDREIASERWDMICYGHTHEATLWMGNGHTIVMNPGALHRIRTPSVAIVKLPELEVMRINI